MGEEGVIIFQSNLLPRVATRPLPRRRGNANIIQYWEFSELNTSVNEITERASVLLSPKGTHILNDCFITVEFYQNHEGFSQVRTIVFLIHIAHRSIVKCSTRRTSNGH